MSKPRKPIPAPIPLAPPKGVLEDKYKIPFIIAEGPRMMLNFLALNSGLPDAYRNMISNWIRGYNEKLIEYISANYGGEEAVADADRIAKLMFTGFIKAIHDEREAADKEMFDGLDRDIFGGDVFPGE